MLLGVAMQIVSIGMSGGSGAVVAPRFLNIVITIGVATGLAGGSHIAWNLGRILNILVLILTGVMAVSVLATPFFKISSLMVFVWMSASLLPSTFIFFALGAQDIRVFCGIKINMKEAQPKHPR